MEHKNLTKPILISFVVITYNRKELLEEALYSIQSQDYWPVEIIVVDNNSLDGTDVLVKEKFPKVQYIQLNRNRGVASRNIGIKRAKGDILVFVDDDAILKNKNAFLKIKKAFAESSTLGILAFKIVNYFSRRIERKEFPHRNKKLDPNKQFETTYFIGAGHAIKKEVFKKVGFYPEDFFYGDEEIDFSFKVIDAGYKIVYFPEVTVFHKQSPKGRLPYKERWQRILENRIKLSIKNLPWRYVLSRTLVWTGFVLWKMKFNLEIVLQAYWNIFKRRKTILSERKVIGKEAVSKIKKLQGRLYY